MRPLPLTLCVLVGLQAGALAPFVLSSPASAQSPEARAVAFLAREVPRWKADNDCYSCHNNGDAARALIVARGRGHDVGTALDDTLAWLRQPVRWNHNKTQGGIDDKPLARVQFAGALRLAVQAHAAPATALRDAAEIVAADQHANGSWRLDTSQSIGSPATYGTALATWAARSVIVASGREDLTDVARKADQWLRSASVDNVVDAAAVVLGLEHAADPRASAKRREALATLRKGQSSDGGWGPYATVGPEVFDTALVALALSQLMTTPSLAQPSYTRESLSEALSRARAFLVAQQLPDGSWPETTRPTGQESYAQRISTAGWALLALLDSGR